MKFTLIFVVLSLVALSYAIPSPRVPRELFKRATAPVPENVDDLKDGGEDKKDLEGSESAYHGYYGGWPGSYYGGYPYSYYSSAYWPSYAYRPAYSYWW